MPCPRNVEEFPCRNSSCIYCETASGRRVARRRLASLRQQAGFAERDVGSRDHRQTRT